ncbi:hypothetical protein ACE7GA_20520 [Roseomonas sp. CCTCC AB2023176]|uniref:hypothetical protein n=1 Tax=Roseomonas sp. CCTCC AB2023176 TaxID=3342640 RepID=UPI0035DE34B4
MSEPPPADSLAGRRILLCYGLFGEVMAGLRPFGLDYMGAQAAWLRARGAAVTVVPCPTAAPVARNAERIGDVLLSDSRPAILVGHSKGGLEALAALVDSSAAARAEGLVALQSPFFGSPVADLLLGPRPLHGFADGAMRLLRLGDGQGLRDLTTAARAEWMRLREAEVAALLARLPAVCVATAVDVRAPGRGRAYLTLARWLEARGAGPNDGLVPVASALLPGARHIVLRGGHRAAASTGRGREPVAVLQRALSALRDPGRVAA